MSDNNEAGEVESQLRGNTLRVYWYILSQNEPVGVREVQRAIGMSSPSVASHHLSKLVDLELVEKTPDNSYDMKRFVKVGVLRNFIEFRGRFLPRYVFVAFFFTAYFLMYLLFTTMTWPGIFDRYIAMGVGLSAALLAWWEAYRLWKVKLG
jgi:DNA-binding transcriptional ArsR family regulator